MFMILMYIFLMKRLLRLFYDFLRKILNSILLWDLILSDVFVSFFVVILIWFLICGNIVRMYCCFLLF